MPRSPGLFLLLLVLQPLPALGLGLRSAGGRNPECGPCRPERCPEPVRCPLSFPTSDCVVGHYPDPSTIIPLRSVLKCLCGPCSWALVKQEAPVVITPPQSVHNVTGAQVYLSCEVRAVPTPVVTWRKVTRSPEGTQVMEELPGDHTNIAVQVQGGPSDHEATAWVLINPLRKEDEGVYQCHSANAVGEAQSHGTVTVVDRSQYRAPRFPAPDDRL
ncbi:PREDICTED: insulin-like growth factor-binding protein-like 1 [Bison bison bison]|uniref:Insulin-like growth factor-binding protein-like 1 n=1 Tax=Bison bison bison TaxID=43346 RepID=A0A6P3I160_BISBB|nr:PREDICTED: insulin-like growth factor-binding protein-like 1 [Bison bison bison]